MPSLPTGTVTFLFTDIEGSTALLQRLGDRRYAAVLTEHQRLLREAFAKGSGHEIDTQGDAFLVAFPRARDAVATAVAAQKALTKHPWQEGASFRVRMGLHTGEPVSGTRDYVGLDVHRAARICSAGHGSQILLSQTVADLAAPDLPAGVSLRDLGAHRLKDLKDPEHLFQVLHPELVADFPHLKSLDARPNNLPLQLTSFIGRVREIAEVKQLLGAARLVTLTGSGGAGKTRLALQVAAEALEEFPDGVWLVELAPLSDPSLVPKTVASALNVPEQPERSLTETLTAALRLKTVLVILDNCEHLVAACARLTDTLLRVCPNLRVLQASEFFAEGLAQSQEVGNRWLSRECVEGLAWVACAHGHYEHSARLLGAAEALCKTFGLRRPPPNQVEHERRVASAKVALGEKVFGAIWAEGRAMTLKQAVEYALATRRTSGTD